jgi:hypothetical protein
VLLSKNWSVGRRVAVILAATAAAGLIPYAVMRATGRWVEPSSLPGVLLGLLGAAIIFFEMALYVRKKFRRFKGWPPVLWNVRVWLWVHVVLGIAVLPVILVHGKYGFGGFVPALTMALFLATIASGVWGLVVQQWLPQELIDSVPDETVASQVNRVAAAYVGRKPVVWSKEHDRDRTGEIFRLLEGLTLEGAEPGEVLPVPGGGAAVAARSEALVRGKPAEELWKFCEGLLVPYLERGKSSGSPLASEYDARRRFTQLRESLPAEAFPAIDRLEELAQYRREWDAQRRVNGWLHAWVPVHLGLSAAMTGLMIVHAVRALKYW